MRVEAVHGPGDPRLRIYRNVRDPDLRREGGLFLAEGRLNVRRLVESTRYPLHSLFLTPAALSGLRAALEALPDDVPVYVGSRAVLNDVVGFDLHRGCIAAGLRSGAPPLEALVPAAPAPSLLVVLEQVTNPDNVGGVFRNALAFGADAVLCCPRTSDPLYRKSIRVSMGATLQLPFARLEAWPLGLEKLRAAGYRSIALHPAARRELGGIGRSAPTVPDRLALVLGTEGSGLASETRALVDDELRIAMAPGIDSLNVATAAAIVLHRVLELRRTSSP